MVRILYLKPGRLLIIAIFIVSCKFTTTKSFEPVITKNAQELENALNAIIAFEHTSYIGQEQTTNGVKKRILNIEVLNARNLPTENQDLLQIARKIATVFKQSVEQPENYQDIKITFLNKNGSGLVSSSNSWSVSYTPDEL